MTSVWIPRKLRSEEYHGKDGSHLKWGLAQSENYISAWLMKQFSTPQAVVDLMHRMGIRQLY